MISIESLPVSLDEIVVRRDTRQRSRVLPEKVEDLAQKILAQSLIHAIVLSANRELVVGETRLEAFRFLRDSAVPCPYPEYQDWTHIPCHFADAEATPEELEAVELVENVARTQLSWQDECLAVHRIHELLLVKNPEQSMSDTAQFLGISSPSISRYLRVAEELQKDNQRVVNAGGLSGAMNVIERETSRAIANEMETLFEVESEKEEESNDPSAPVISFDDTPRILPLPTPIIQGDALQWLSSFSGEKFNFLHCDFPYGINYDKAQQGNVKRFHTYADSPDLFWALVEALIQNRDRILMRSAHIMFWFSPTYMIPLYDRLRRGLPNSRVDDFPLIWHKSDNKGLLPDSNRGGRRTYEMALHITLSDRHIVKPVALSYAGPATKEGSLSTKPEPMLRHFFQMYVDEHTHMADPTCGSATSLRAADSQGAARVFGLEIDSEQVEMARENYQGYLRRKTLLENAG